MKLPDNAFASAFECESLGDELAFEILPLCLDDVLPTEIIKNYRGSYIIWHGEDIPWPGYLKDFIA